MDDVDTVTIGLNVDVVQNQASEHVTIKLVASGGLESGVCSSCESVVSNGSSYEGGLLLVGFCR